VPSVARREAGHPGGGQPGDERRRVVRAPAPHHAGEHQFLAGQVPARVGHVGRDDPADRPVELVGDGEQVEP
jgi:hypothetical protein